MTAKAEVIAIAELVAGDGKVAPGKPGTFDVDTAKSLVARGLAKWPVLKDPVQATAAAKSGRKKKALSPAEGEGEGSDGDSADA